MPSGRPKGGNNRYWTVKEKEKILLECKEKGIGGTKAAKEYGISRAQYFNWSKAYLESGIKGLDSKRRPGNPLSKYSSRKVLTEKEQMEYEIMKLRIENERLKKGYMVKGDGLTKQFIILKDKNSK
jgi:transposase-like protein